MTLTVEDKADIRADFFERQCPICEKPKKKGTAFCPGCYFSLPKHMRRNLLSRFFNGYEEAQDEAARWLIEAQS